MRAAPIVTKQKELLRQKREEKNYIFGSIELWKIEARCRHRQCEIGVRNVKVRFGFKPKGHQIIDRFLTAKGRYKMLRNREKASEQRQLTSTNSSSVDGIIRSSPTVNVTIIVKRYE